MTLYEWKPGQCNSWALHPECDVRGTWMPCIYGLLQKTIRNTFFVALHSHLFFFLYLVSLCLITNWIINSLHSLAQSTWLKDSFSHYISSLCLSPHLGVGHAAQSQLLDQFFDFLIFLLLRDGRWETQRCREGEVLSDRQCSHHHVVLETRNHHFNSRISLNISRYFWCCDFMRLEEAALIVAVTPFLPRPGNSAKSKPFYWLLAQSWLL